MGAAIDAIGDSWTALRSNPTVILLTFVLGIVSIIISLIGAVFSLFIPGIGNLITAPVIAALFAGLIGAAAVAARQDGSITFGQYETELGNSGFEVFLATALKQLLYFGMGVGVMILVIIVAVFGAGVSNPEQVTAATAGGMLLAFLLLGVGLLAVLLVAFFLQFVNAAIAIDGASPTGSFKSSYRTVRENLLSATGYVCLRYGILVGLWLVVFFAIGVVAGLGNETAGLLFGALASLVLAPVSYAWFYLYHAHYYMRISSADTVNDGLEPDAPPAPERLE